MFVSVFACPCCGTVIQPVNPIQVGRQVQCFACRTTFVVTAKMEDSAPPEPPTPAPLPPGYPLETTPQSWIKKSEPDYHPARGHFRRKRPRPNFGLIAFLITGSITLVMLLGLGGILGYRQLRDAALTLKKPRLVGVWVADFGRNGNASMDFRSNGELFVVIDRPHDVPHHEEQQGTWQILNEKGDQLKVRMKTRSTTGDVFDITKDFTFHGENAFSVSERTESWRRKSPS
jgi:hypothetical protein